MLLLSGVLCTQVNNKKNLLLGWPNRTLFHRSAVFLLHIAVEIPIAIQGLWAPAQLPFLELNNTTLVMLKVRRKSISMDDAET